MNIVSKTVIDAWMQRYKKEMSPEEYKAWAKNFDEKTVVRVELDGVEFITRDYVREKDLADEIKN
jgi:deoxyadenosine/deoxycytidine kinase